MVGQIFCKAELCFIVEIRINFVFYVLLDTVEFYSIVIVNS